MLDGLRQRLAGLPKAIGAVDEARLARETDSFTGADLHRLIEDGKKLEILMTIDDPATFNEPWQAMRQYDRLNRTLSEDICSENNINPFGIDYGTPVAEKPDF